MDKSRLTCSFKSVSFILCLPFKFLMILESILNFKVSMNCFWWMLDEQVSVDSPVIDERFIERWAKVKFRLNIVANNIHRLVLYCTSRAIDTSTTTVSFI